MQYPDWLDRREYPFPTRYFDAGPGRMHYVDSGPPSARHTILFLHGNPTWSFQYRNVIRQLDNTYRCIAPDWLGFGLSDEPDSWSYRPQDHVKCLRRLVSALKVQEISLVAHDWGGPIGLQFAVDEPDRIHGIVILNTWMWPPADHLRIKTFALAAGSGPARFVIRHFNALTLAMPLGFGRPWRLSRKAHAHYLRAQQGRRRGCTQLPKAFLGSADWLEDLWARRRALEGIPKKIVWGARDPILGTQPLDRWLDAFQDTEPVVLNDVGHFVSEEDPNAVTDAIRRLLEQQPRYEA